MKKMKDKPKTMGNFLCLRNSLVKPFVAIHCFSNNEYHDPPIKNVEMAAANMAGQLSCAKVFCISMVPFVTKIS